MLKPIYCRRLAGFTLVELMISIALGLLVAAAVTSAMVSTLVTNTTNVKTTRLEQELRAVMSMIVRDARRAGYWANANSDIDANKNNNPFTTNDADVSPREPLKVDDVLEGNLGGNICPTDNAGDGDQVTLTGSCLVFSYDLDDGNDLDDNEHFGFKLTGNRIQSISSGSACSASGCTCNTGTWENLTDENAITITNLDFDVVTTFAQIFGTRLDDTDPNSLDAYVAVREVTITLTGTAEVPGGTTVTKTIEETVRIRNDRFCAAT